MLLALAASKGSKLIQMDIKTAYLNSKIDLPDIFVHQAEGFIDKTHPHKVRRLLKSQYGIKQAGRLWNQMLDSILQKSGLTRSKRDNCLYYKLTEKESTVIIVYVDDMLGMTSTNLDHYTNAIKQANLTIEIMPVVNEFLGLSIKFYPIHKIITVDQIGYIEQILDKFKMIDCKPISTPMSLEKLTKDMSPTTLEDKIQMDKTPYREAVGSLMYLAISTRPDISKALSEVSRYLENPGEKHWQAVKRIMRYLKGTKTLALYLGNDKTVNPQINAFTDSDWGGSEERRSTTGYAIFLGKSLISWKSRLQTTIALSTTEAEYYAVGDGIKEILHLLPVANDMGTKQILPIMLRSDNQGCIKIANNNQLNDRSRHIDIKHYFIQQEVENKRITVEYIDTKQNVADIFTKALGQNPHMSNLPKLGLFSDIREYCKHNKE
jgi:hypothetical protein